MEEWYFSNFEAKKHILNSFDNSFANNILNLYKKEQLTAIGSILAYLTNTLKSIPKHISDIHLDEDQNRLNIDINSRNNLELDNNSKSSLLNIMDKCKTSLGSRLLRRYFKNPTRDLNKISLRHNVIKSFRKQHYFLKFRTFCLI